MNRTLSQIFFRQIHLIALASALVISVLVVYTERTILINDLIDKGDGIAKVLSSVTLDAVLSHNYATIERYVREIADEPAIISVAVRRADGELLASAGLANNAAGHAFHHPVLLGDENFAEITIVFSTARIDRILRTIMLGAILIISLFHLLGIYISNLALRRAVINPLAKLKKSITTIQQGQFHERCAIASPLELAELGSAFNDMADAIQQSFAQIEANQKTLAMERSKLAAIVTNMADGLFVTDINGVIISFNNSAERISGFSEAEALGHKCSDLFRSNLCRDACALYHAGETINNRPTFLTTKGGETLAVAVSSAMLYDAEGEAVGGVQTFRDITADQKRQEVFCHTEKLAAIGQLAAGLAHEINNPLGNILGYTKYLDQNAPPEEFAKRVAIIIEQTQRCSGIVKGLLDFARRSASRPEIIDPNNLLARIVEIVRFQADKKGITIHLDLQAAGMIVADPQKIEQVVLNLLLNAIQAISGPGNIWVGTARRLETILLTVADDGPGIAPEIASRIFDPFYTTKPVGEGTGLGLAISEGIVIEAGGAIDVEDRPGGGAIFTVILPGVKFAIENPHLNQ
jgi:PAS domain S-box-containing protein